MRFDEVTKQFSWPDYAVFSLVLLLSAGIGVYYAIKDRKKKNSTEEFLMGGRKMAVLPVSMSLVASFTSAISLLGFSTEMYSYGTMYMIMGASYFISVPIAVHVFVPVFHRLEITSAYEYFELRFSRAVRLVASAMFIFQMLLYMAVVLYAPALALNQVSNLSLWISIFVVGMVCTFYTVLGGMKAVMWTDTFQMAIVYGGIIAIIVEGCKRVGGFGYVWEIAQQKGRIQFDNYSPDPFQRHTYFTLLFGGCLTSLTVYASNQAMIQRYLSVKKLRDAQMALYFALPGFFVILGLTCICGLVAFARYHDCDPKSVGLIQNSTNPTSFIQKYDQILPFLVMDILGHLSGFPGLFVACLFSASLSTVSSGVNSLAAVCLRDFIQPAFKIVKKCEMNDRQSIIVSKMLATFFGLVTIAMAFLADVLGSTVLQVSLSIFGMIGGPLLGLFVLGMFFPWANSKGALAGSICAILLTTWIAIGAVMYPSAKRLPMDTSGCDWNVTMRIMAVNTSRCDGNCTMTTMAPIDVAGPSSGLLHLYRLSYLWYSGLAVSITVLVGLAVSFLTGPTDPSTIDPKLMFSFSDRLCCCLPVSMRYKLRCGVQYQKEEPMLTFTQSTALLEKAKLADKEISLTFNSSYVAEKAEVGEEKESLTPAPVVVVQYTCV